MGEGLLKLFVNIPLLLENTANAIVLCTSSISQCD